MRQLLHGTRGIPHCPCVAAGKLLCRRESRVSDMHWLHWEHESQCVAVNECWCDGSSAAGRECGRLIGRRSDSQGGRQRGR